MFMDSIRALLGESVYEWILQVGQMIDWLWNSLLVWRLLVVVLLVWLISKKYRRAN